MRSNDTSPPLSSSALTRRQLVGVAASGVVVPRLSRARLHRSAAGLFYGEHQRGIVTPPQRHLTFASFDVTATGIVDLRDLLRSWSGVAAALCSARGGDPEERLTITFGFGRELFVRESEDRFGLANRCPRSFMALPSFPTDALDPDRSDGDIGVQICSESQQGTFISLRRLVRAANGIASPRWIQSGFRTGGRSGARNLLGFRDGTHNISPDDPGSLERFVWIGAEGPAWLRGGTYLVARRISLDLTAWDALSIRQQESMIGRRKKSGAPLGEHGEFDPIVLANLPPTSHVRLAATATSLRILRRSYNYVEDQGAVVEPTAGLQFISFQRSVEQQFVPLQRRLAASDALNRFARHTASAVFAIPPGARRTGDFIGQRLLHG